MTTSTEGHTIKRFDGELSHIHQLTLEMGGLVIDQIHRAMRALEDEDPEAARAVIERDQRINELDVKLDQEIVRLLAIRNPVGFDLRAVVTLSKIVSDVERCGDEARKLASLAIRLYDSNGSAPPTGLIRDIFNLAGYSAEMLRDAIDTFDELNLSDALAIIRANEELEAEFEGALRRASTYVLEDARSVGHFIQVILCLRAMERIGGHAKNIAGYIFFLVKGKDVRHLDLDDLIDELGDQER